MALVGMTSKTVRVPDQDLVRWCLAGDPNGWRTLYDRHVSQVMRFVAALGVGAEDREDAVQDVFIAVYRSLGSFRGEAQLSTWIYRIAARHVNRLASRRRMREMLSHLLWRELKHQPAIVDGYDGVERASELELLDTLLQKLSPKKRMALVLFEIEGLPVEEVAQIVGCPVNTVWSRLHHARAELGKLAAKVHGRGQSQVREGRS